MTIALEALDVSLGIRPVLRGIEATIAGGGLTGVIGPNGAGKSTLVRALAGLLSPTNGRIGIDGISIGDIPRAQLARTIAYLPQGQMLHWPLEVERLVGLGRLPHLAPFSRVGEADQGVIERAMAITDVTALRHRVATELSGGERARVLLARALAVEAPVLIADEPLASLDPGHQLEVMEVLKGRAAAGTLVVVVLHDLTMAARFCDHLLLLDEGRLVAEGMPADVLTPQRLADVYGVTAWIGTGEQQPLIVPLHRSG